MLTICAGLKQLAFVQSEVAGVLLTSCVQEMRDPGGTLHNVFPRLLTVIADMKEKWELICLYGSGRVNRPCPTCSDTKGAMARKIERLVECAVCVPSRCVAHVFV
jgi:hypothetical protein